MDTNTALLLKGDEATILNLVYANGEDPVAAVKAALDAARKIPGVIGKMQDGLIEIVAHPNLQFEDGRFTLIGDVGAPELHDILAKTVDFYQTGESAGNMGRWILGNMAYLAESRLGERWLDLLDGTDHAYNTIVTSKTTFEFFSEKRYPMPFSHHKELAYAKDLSPEQKHGIAAFVAERQLSHTACRAIIKLMQNQVRDGATAEDPETLYGKIEQPTRAGKRFLVINPGNRRSITDRAPDGAELEEAEEVYEIRAVLKGQLRRDGAAPADGAIPPANAPTEPGAPD